MLSFRLIIHSNKYSIKVVNWKYTKGYTLATRL